MQDVAGKEWTAQIIQWKEKLNAVGQFKDLAPWTGLPQTALRGVSPTPRHHAILNCLTMEVIGDVLLCRTLLASPEGQAELRRRMAPVFVDLSQNPSRRAFSNRDGIMKCLTTSSRVYSFAADRLTVPAELMACQGHDVDNMLVPEAMTLKEMKDVAGMGICLPNLAVYILAMRSAMIL